MHVTLAQYQRLTQEQKAQVTSIDASVADEGEYKTPPVNVWEYDDWDYTNAHIGE